MFSKFLATLVLAVAASQVAANGSLEHERRGICTRQTADCIPCGLSMDLGSKGSFPSLPNSCPDGLKCYGIYGITTSYANTPWGQISVTNGVRQ